MAVTRAYIPQNGGKRHPLVRHGYVDDTATGGEIVLTAEEVAKGVTPTNAGVVNGSNHRWLLISLKNNSESDILWTTIPHIKGTNEHVDGNKQKIVPAYGHGSALVNQATDGVFSSTLDAGAEELIRVETKYAGWGVILQAEAPAQALDLSTFVLGYAWANN